VPAGVFGFRQRIEISQVSGLSNVKCWLEEHGYDPEDAVLSEALFSAAKVADRVLDQAECERLIAAARARSVADATRH
jgi:hypothetical protein